MCSSCGCKSSETFFDSPFTDEQLLKVARIDIDNHIDNGTFYVLGEEPQAFHDGEIDGENFYTIVSLYAQHHEDEDKAEKILKNMFKKEYPQYLGADFNAEYHRDSKGRFVEKPILTGSVIGGLALGLIYLMRGK